MGLCPMTLPGGQRAVGPVFLLVFLLVLNGLSIWGCGKNDFFLPTARGDGSRAASLTLSTRTFLFLLLRRSVTCRMISFSLRVTERLVSFLP